MIIIETIAILIVVGFYFYVKNQQALSSQDTPISIPVVKQNTETDKLPEVKKPEPIIEDKTIRILTLGDTALLEPIGSSVANDPAYDPFLNVKEFFKKFNYIVANLEATIDGASVGSPTPGKAFTFSIPIQSVDVFKKAGITAVSYSNNHTKDYGSKSVNHTIEVLTAAGIGTFGAGANNDAAYTPLIADLKYAKVAFLGFNSAEYAFNHAGDNSPGTASFSEGRVRSSIKNAKSLADIVIVYAHWGVEHTQNLDPVWQVQWANIFTSAGADIVIGSHPHVVQKQDVVNGKPVFYSLGNFMFPGQGWDPEALKGAAVEIDIVDKKISELKVHPTTMTAEGIPSIVE